jgi:hypothetical protein
MAEKAGLPAVIDAEARSAPPPGDDDGPTIQHDLFDQPEYMAEGEGAGDVERPEGGRRGRPPGSRNRRTSDLAAYIALHIGHPVVRLARIAQMSPSQLAKELNCKKVEALDRIIVAAKAAAPYVASTMPQEIVLQPNGALAVGIMPVSIKLPGGDRVVDADPLAVLDMLANGNIEEIQRLSRGEDVEGNVVDGNASPDIPDPSRS